jgi:hypothetical protein
MPRPPAGSAPVIHLNGVTRAKEFRESLAAAPNLDARVALVGDHLEQVIEHQEAQEAQAITDKGEIMDAIKGVAASVEKVSADISSMKKSEDQLRAALLVELGNQAHTNEEQNKAIVKVAAKLTAMQQVKVVAKWIAGAGGVLTGGDLIHRLIDFILAAAKH